MHLMIDMETFGNGPDAAVATFGAVIFDPTNNTVDVDSSIEFALSVPDQIKLGRKFDSSTVAWWLTQSEEARKVVLGPLNGKGLKMEEFVTHFGQWLRDRGWTPKTSLKVWSHGATFDIVITTSMYRMLDLDPPWRFVNARDTRTVFDWFKPKPVTYGIAHKAVDDAIKQAMMVNECFQKHQGKSSETAPPVVEQTYLPPYITREYFEANI